ncbi:MAG: hypothetical protein QNJ15_09740 [Erythrobacter sp.]|nr:hypothetical protein [Erythrobacter sp.]
MPKATENAIKINPDAIREAISNPKVRANSDWCVACGASAAAGPELPRIVEQQISQDPEMIKGLVREDFVSKLSEKLASPDLNADWCVACGASAATAPGALVSNPATISDDVIDALATRLIARG